MLVLLVSVLALNKASIKKKSELQVIVRMTALDLC